jgi:molybdate/tungstate transport system substrate-binding protein
MKIPHTLAATALCALLLFAGCGSGGEKKTLVIYHHGSPSPAIEAAQKVFQTKYPDVTVLREKGDALPNMRKVTDLGKHADLVYTDAYSIIPPVMFPKFADSWIRYAHDEMTIAYGPNSKYAKEITPDNWFEILQRPDVKWGIADPNAGHHSNRCQQPHHDICLRSPGQDDQAHASGSPV